MNARKKKVLQQLVAGIMLDQVRLASMFEPMEAMPAPFGMLDVPPLQEAALRGSAWKRPGWSIVKQTENLPPVVRAYYRGFVEWEEPRENWVLYGPPDETVWMSVSPMERESLVVSVKEAEGRVLVGGLGLGLVLFGLMKKKNVEEVVVVEKEAAVVHLMQPQVEAWIDSLGPARGPRVRIVTGDLFDVCNEWRNSRTHRPFDYALIDIWPTIGDTAIEPDLMRLRDMRVAHTYSAWGIELAFVTWLVKQKPKPDPERPLPWEYFERALGMNLVGRTVGGFETWCVRAARNAIQSPVRAWGEV